ncbi:hypothetical protein WMY93_034273, partial [Mugilogobius chulae]
MAASSRSQAISLYKMLLRESRKFPSYNYSRKAVATTTKKYIEEMPLILKLLSIFGIKL